MRGEISSESNDCVLSCFTAKSHAMITEELLISLLYEHDCVIVPDLGGFIAKYTPAQIHPVLHTFSPPARSIAFNAALRHNDGLLANAIAGKMGISYNEAVDIIAREVGDLKKNLNNNQNLHLPKIGSLFLDKERNVQFNPDLSVNYLNDSFGLTSFTSPAIKREAMHEKISRKLAPRQAIKSARLLPATLKWAAVALPLIGLGLWATLNPDKITNLYSNPATFLPAEWTAETPPVRLKPETKKVNAAELTNQETAVEPLTSAENNPVAETEKAPEDVSISAPETEKSMTQFVIVGAFGVKENAENLVSDLRTRGYDSFITGQNRKGLYMVSILGFSDKQLAIEKMAEIRTNGYPNAWLLSKE